MNAISVLREDIKWANELLEMVMADVTSEQAHWQPPGIANPLGAIYAHAVFSQDALIQGMLQGGAPLFASTWAGQCGVGAPQMQLDLDWARGLRVDLPALREYAQAVYAATDEYVASLTEDDLERQIDLSNVGLGQRSLSWVLAALVASHVNCMAGEASCLKGLQGRKGYPF